MNRKKITLFLKDPFIILLGLIIFFFVGRWLIRTFNSAEDQRLKGQVWQTVQQIKQTLSSQSAAFSLATYCHKRLTVVLPGKRYENRDSLLVAWQSWHKDLRVTQCTVRDSTMQLFGKGRFAIITFYYELAGTYQHKDFSSQGWILANLVKEQGKWWLTAMQVLPQQ